MESFVDIAFGSHASNLLIWLSGSGASKVASKCLVELNSCIRSSQCE